MSLSELIERYGTEAQCEKALEHSRWPDGFVCPECGGREHSRFLADGRRYWQCSTCPSQSSVCSGTLFHASKLPLTKWFQAIYLVTQNKNNISALSLKRHLGVSYTTAWRVKHKLLEAMRRRESRRLLHGVVFADDAVLGGVHPGKPDRGSQNKAPFMAAVELDDNGYPGHVRFDPIDDYKGTTFSAWAKSALHPKAHLVTDGCAISTPPAPRSLPTARSSSATTNPARWSRSAGSTLSSPTPRAPLPAPTIISTSTSTATAILPRCRSASTAASIWPHWSGGSHTLAHAPRLARSARCGARRFRPAEPSS